jgi:hypothetical protein
MPAVNGVGKPCAREPHARFDGRGLETERPGQGHWGGTTDRETGGTRRPQALPPGTATAPAPRPYAILMGPVGAAAGCRFQRLAVPGFPAVAPGGRGSTGPGVCPSWW